jgi:hypothetical protein
VGEGSENDSGDKMGNRQPPPCPKPTIRTPAIRMGGRLFLILMSSHVLDYPQTPVLIPCSSFRVVRVFRGLKTFSLVLQTLSLTNILDGGFRAMN